MSTVGHFITRDCQSVMYGIRPGHALRWSDKSWSVCVDRGRLTLTSSVKERDRSNALEQIKQMRGDVDELDKITDILKRSQNTHAVTANVELLLLIDDYLQEIAQFNKLRREVESTTLTLDPFVWYSYQDQTFIWIPFLPSHAVRQETEVNIA